VPEFNFIVSSVHDLHPKFHNTALWMKNWEQSCPGWSNVPPKISKKISAVNQNITELYLNKVTHILHNLDDKFVDIPQILRNVQVAMQQLRTDWWLTITALTFAPAILATLVMGFITHAVLATGNHPRMAKWTNFLVLDLGAIPIVAVIALMTVLSALLLFVGVNAGLFCAAYEKNTINLISATQNGNRTSDVTGLVEFYLSGAPADNAIVENLRTVRGILAPLAPFIGIVAFAVDFLGVFCSSLGKSDLGQVISETTSAIQQILPMAKRQRVFEHYNDIVVMGMCDTFVGSLGWYLICSLISGMILLPLVAWQSHTYLSEVAHEKTIPLQEDEKPLVGHHMDTATINWDSGISHSKKGKDAESGNGGFLGCCGRQSRPVFPK